MGGVAPIGAQGSSLFTLDPSVDTSQLPQCNDPGVTNCQAVLVNQEVLDGLTVSGTVDLLPSSPIGLLRLKAPPMRQRSGSGRSSRSYSFTEGRWGDATITFGNSGSIYGRISPESGSVIYIYELWKWLQCHQGTRTEFLQQHA